MQLINLRNKILSCGLLILILVTSFNLYYSYKVFKEDKESYIFENVLRSCELIDRELAKLISNPQDTSQINKKISSPKFKEITSLMDTDKIFSYVLLLNDKIIYGDEKIFNKNTASVNTHQAQVTEEEINGKKYLLGLVKNKSNNITTIAYIDKSKAFSSLNYLIKKNIFFSLIIFGVVLILTTYFARTITTPILQIIQKTVEISNGDYNSKLRVKTNDELRILGDSINTMSQEIKTLLDQKQNMIIQLEKVNKQLDIYSKDLEVLVEERTRDLKDANAYITAMLNSLTQGLFVVRRDGTCSKLFTNSCLTIFGSSPEEHHFADYIKVNNTASVNKWLELTFSEKMPFESCAQLGVSHYQEGTLSDENFKFIKFDYFPLILDDTLSGVVVLATDYTEKMVLEESIKRKEEYINNVAEYILNKESIKSLVKESNNLLDEIIHSPSSTGFCDRALMIFHTLNGGFANYSFTEIQKFAIECEEFIQSNEDNTLTVNSIKSRAAKAKDLINQSMKSLQEKFTNHDMISFEKADVEYLSHALNSMGEDGKNILENFLNKKSISSIFGPYPRLIEKISKTLGKPMKEFIIPKSNYRVNPSHVQELSSSLVHLFKNSMDHGIENTETRVKAGKPKQGEIKVKITTNKDHIKITISDDGAGVNIPSIEQKLLETHSREEINALSRHQLMAKIFDPNFSTRNCVSEFSGRGIGMSAVKEAIEKLNGSINIESEESLGTSFELSFKV